MRRPTLLALTLAIVVSGTLAASAQAAPAPSSDTSYTLTTDAGTTCTYDIESTIGAGLLARPISHESTILCKAADPSKVPVVLGGGVTLQSSLPLGIGGSASSPKTPPTRLPAAEEAPTECDAAEGVDCGFTGQGSLLPAATYTLISGFAIPAPEGETWNAAPTGCEVSEEGVAGCFYKSAPFTAG